MSALRLTWNLHWQAMSVGLQVSKEHWKKHDLTACGQAVMVELTRLPRAAALLEFRQLAQLEASEGNELQ